MLELIIIIIFIFILLYVFYLGISILKEKFTYPEVIINPLENIHIDTHTDTDITHTDTDITHTDTDIDTRTDTDIDTRTDTDIDTRTDTENNIDDELPSYNDIMNNSIQKY